jgi:hypothetical protein
MYWLLSALRHPLGQIQSRTEKLRQQVLPLAAVRDVMKLGHAFFAAREHFLPAALASHTVRLHEEEPLSVVL